MNRCGACEYGATDLAPGYCCQGCRNKKGHDAKCMKLDPVGQKCLLVAGQVEFGVFRVWRGTGEGAVLGLEGQEKGQPNRYVKISEDNGASTHANHKPIPHKDCWLRISEDGYIQSVLRPGMYLTTQDGCPTRMTATTTKPDSPPWTLRPISDAAAASTALHNNHLIGRQPVLPQDYFTEQSLHDFLSKGYMVVTNGVESGLVGPVLSRVNSSFMVPETVKADGVWGGDKGLEKLKDAVLYKSAVWPCLDALVDGADPFTTKASVCVEPPLNPSHGASTDGQLTESELYDSEEDPSQMMMEPGPEADTNSPTSEHSDDAEPSPTAPHSRTAVDIIVGLDTYPIHIGDDVVVLERGDFLISTVGQGTRPEGVPDGGIMGMTMRYSIQHNGVKDTTSLPEPKGTGRCVDVPRPLYGSTSLTEEMKRSFVKNGFVVVPNVVPEKLVSRAVKAINDCLFLKKTVFRRADGSVDQCMGELFRSHVIVSALYHSDGWGIVKSLLGSALRMRGCQIALRAPSPLHYGASLPEDIGPKWHIDGHIKKGNHTPFSLLVGVALSTTTHINNGNLCVWPGGHERLLPTLKERHAQGQPYLSPLPDVGSGHQVTVHRGDLLLCHQKLPHQYSPNVGPDTRYMLYFRIKQAGLKDKVPTAVHLDNLWTDYPGLKDVL